MLLGTHLSFRAARRSVIRTNPRRVAAPAVDWWRSRIGGPGGGRVDYTASQEVR